MYNYVAIIKACDLKSFVSLYVDMIKIKDLVKLP